MNKEQKEMLLFVFLGAVLGAMLGYTWLCLWLNIHPSGKVLNPGDIVQTKRDGQAVFVDTVVRGGYQVVLLTGERITLDPKDVIK